MSAAVTMGSFDGLHRGHAAVLRALHEEAAARGLPSAVVTFEPHPLQLLDPRRAPRRLSGPAERTLGLVEAGVDRLHVLPFTPELAGLDARTFVRRVLLEELGCRVLVAGEDHRFGRGRAAGAPELRALAEAEGFAVRVVPHVIVDGAAASSTRTRAAVEAGDLALAERLLGRPYGVFAPVVRGAGRGSGLGVPTANLALPPGKQMPPAGVYAARAHVDGRAWAAAAHWGGRPTFGEAASELEAHLIGFEGDLYGAWVELAFVERIRDVVGFPDAAELVEAMREDLRRAAEAVDAAQRAPAPL